LNFIFIWLLNQQPKEKLFNEQEQGWNETNTYVESRKTMTPWTVIRTLGVNQACGEETINISVHTINMAIVT
jgi:hypothetical protein